MYLYVVSFKFLLQLQKKYDLFVNWSALIGGKFMLKKCFQDFLSSLKAVISTNESTEFITSHVIYKQTYTYKFQLKTTIIYCKKLKTFSLLSNFK